MALETDDLVEAQLKKVNASAETIALWSSLLKAYDEGGPSNVKELLQAKVQESKKRAGKEAREVGRVVAVAARPKRKGKR
jgi:hypothetical protein